jgi:hypothetical protein
MTPDGNPKDALRALSHRLDPARREFAILLYQRSAELIQHQVLDSSSLFWRLPNHVLMNLERLLGGGSTKLRDFFLQAHSRRHHVARTLLGEAPTKESTEFDEILGRCYQPTKADIRESGLAEPVDPLPALNRAKLIRRIVENGHDVFQRNEESDPNEPGTHRFRIDVHPWFVSITVELAHPLRQISVECDTRIGIGPLSLERQLCLHSILGIGPQGCDLAEPGQERLVADVLVGETRLVVEILKDVLAGVETNVSVEEVRKIETDWIAWLSEARRTRAARRKKDSHD